MSQLIAVQTATAIVRMLPSNNSPNINHITGPQVTPKATAKLLTAIRARIPGPRPRLENVCTRAVAPRE